MTITLYTRTFPVLGAGLFPSLSPPLEGAHYLMMPKGEQVQEVRREIQVNAPDGSRLEKDEQGETGLVVLRGGREVRMDANAVYAFCQMGEGGFSFA